MEQRTLETESRPAWRRSIELVAWLMLLAVILARMLGPSDLHDQTQEKTIAYSVDLALHPERWILPLDSGGQPATKPPMYNWIAAPAVHLSQGRSEFAHKLPSVIALIGVSVLLWLLGRRIAPDTPVGAFAVMVFITNYMWFKLGYLARPDALLTLWLFIGWIIATVIITTDDSVPRRKLNLWRVCLWLSVTFAVLTKGPAALLVPVYAGLLACFVGRHESEAKGVRRCFSQLAWAWRRTAATSGLILALGVGALWLGLVWRIDPDHVREVLIGRELAGHLIGAGEEGSGAPMQDWIRSILDMPFYFFSRFLPWSVFFVVTWFDVFGPRHPSARRGLPDRANSRVHRWIVAALVYPLLVIVFFTFATGKRADYIASAFPPAALLVGWWAWERGLRIGRRVPWLIPFIALLTLISLVTYGRRYGFAAQYPASDVYWQFAREIRLRIAEDPLPLLYFQTRHDSFPTIMYTTDSAISAEELPSRLPASGSVWIAGHTGYEPGLRQAMRAAGWSFERRYSIPVPKSGKPYPAYELALYHAERRDAALP